MWICVEDFREEDEIPSTLLICRPSDEFRFELLRLEFGKEYPRHNTQACTQSTSSSRSMWIIGPTGWAATFISHGQGGGEILREKGNLHNLKKGI